jgi:hypothetical protein
MGTGYFRLALLFLQTAVSELPTPELKPAEAATLHDTLNLPADRL